MACLLTGVVFAQDEPAVDSSGGIIDRVNDVTCMLFALLLYITAAIVALSMIWAGAEYITSEDSVRRANARNRVIYAVIGLIFVIIACPVVNYLVTKTDIVPFERSCDCLGGHKTTTSTTSTSSTTTTTWPFTTTTSATATTSPSGTTTTSGGPTTTASGPTTTSSTTTTTSTTTTSTTPPVQVLIVALKANMQGKYSSAQITGLENKIKDYQAALKNDGLSSLFLYLDQDETSDIIGSKVTKPTDWNDVDGILDQVTTKLPIRYVLIVGGDKLFPPGKITFSQTTMGFTLTYTVDTDNYYADNNKDSHAIPEVAIGRFPDPIGGDMSLLMTEFDTATKLHNSGGLDLAPHVGRALCCGYLPTCFTQFVWGKSCASDTNCKETEADASSAASGKDFFYLVGHGEGGPPQNYVDAFNAGGVNSIDVSNAVWMMVPCYGGIISYQSTGDSIVLTFLKKGGAVHMGATFVNCCAMTGTCTDKIDWVPAGPTNPEGAGVGALYYAIAKKFSIGTRIGDAYKNGKTDYYGLYTTGLNYEYYTNHLYGDPTLRITGMW